MARRGATGLSGVLLLDKPTGMTSHDVVSVLRAATGERRIGHAGTLDPSATGLLVMLLGPATRLAAHLSAARKLYTARIVFGTATDTDDAEGAVIAEAPVPDALREEDVAREALAALVGTHEQIPPAYSAVKVAGRTAHKAARAGEALDLAPRTIAISRAELIGVATEPIAWDVEFDVSKGTYIRSLARDLGVRMGTVAHLGALRRTRSGSLCVDDAHTLDEARERDVSELFTPAVATLGLPVVELDDEGAARVRDGRPLDPGQRPEGLVAMAHKERLLAIYELRDGALRPQTVFPGGVA